MVVGAQKAGTSTLAHYIEQLPGVSTHKLDLEFTYFVDDERYAKGYDSAFSRYFSDAAPSGLLFAKSAGVMFIEGAVNRLAEHNPQVKVIAMLREPVSRAYSAYWYLRRVGIEDAPTFEEGLAREEQRMRSDPRLHMAYRARGDYLPQLRRLVDVFGAAQV